ncbi:hypothetical protein VTO73DRAFT_1520 [Trametes versicolor]
MNIATEIVRGRDDGDLLQLANLYKDHFVRCFYQVKGRTPARSSHPSAPSSEPKKNEIRELLHATPSSNTTAKAQALERDGYRCIISRRPDNPSIDAGLVEFAEEQAVWTQCTHIFDSSTYENLDDRAKAYTASVHAILDRFGAINSIEELSGAKMHRLENVLTLESYIHQSFDQLKLWLQEVPGGPQHTYTVEAPPSHRNHLSCVPNTRVHFTTQDPVKLPLPDPRYLRLHAACARVF